MTVLACRTVMEREAVIRVEEPETFNDVVGDGGCRRSAIVAYTT
jgi:hypothetical protein